MQSEDLPSSFETPPAGKAGHAPPRLTHSVMVPLSLALLFLFLAFVGFNWWRYRTVASERLAGTVDSVNSLFNLTVEDEIAELTGLLKLFGRDLEIQKALAAKDRQALTRLCTPIAVSLKNERGITHCYFSDPERYVIFRAHDPETYGDRIERFTTLEAGKTGKVASGIEIGLRNTLTVRSVLPCYMEGRLIGFIELGTEIGRIEESLERVLSLKVWFAVDKRFLQRKTWEATMQGLGRVPNWDRFPDCVVVNDTGAGVPAPVAAYLVRGIVARPDAGTEASWEGKRFQISCIPLPDASSRTVGQIVAVKDITVLANTHSRALWSIAAIWLAVSAAILLLFRAILSRTQRALNAAHEQLIAASLEREAAQGRHVQEVKQARQAVIDGIADPIMCITRDERIVLANRALREFAGVEEGDVVGRKCRDVLRGCNTPCEQGLPCPLLAAFDSQKPAEEMVVCLLDRQGRERTFEIGASATVGDDARSQHALGVYHDITERKRAEEQAQVSSAETRRLLNEAVQSRYALLSMMEDQKHAEAERAKIEEQLWQAQKMESIGRLAGGVAHDFNNILTGIGGFTELALGQLDATSPMRDDLTEVQRLAKRAAELTRQLLAFSRRQPLAMQVLNLNDVIPQTIKMLKRVLGEDIGLRFVQAEDLGNCLADPGQMEQILMNLTVNARDAMPHGGTLEIETANVELDAEYANLHVAVIPGPYVMLAVSDTGCGMDAATKESLFEPFFTTKEKGKGTGLGLATVYGIVKQHGGNIWVYSEPGKGATFKIYLPKVTEAVTISKPAAKPQTVRGDETILVVEDEASVRAIAERTLKEQGYTVITAGSAEEAERLFPEHSGRISLLLTDVVLPGMNGLALYKRLVANAPNLKVLYMSGYTDTVILQQGLLDPGVAFMQKPFTVETVARKVRQVLDS